MSKASIAFVGLLMFTACDQQDLPEPAPAPAPAPAPPAAPTDTQQAAAEEPEANDEGVPSKERLPVAEDFEAQASNTITADTYEEALDTIEKELATEE